MHFVFKYIFFISFVIFFSCNSDLKDNAGLLKINPTGFYGKSYKPDVNYDISSLLNDLDDLIGEIVEVKGRVTEVCPLRGCWMKISDISKKETIRVKVDDGEIIFPLSALGRIINVKGIFNKILFTEEQAINWKVHLAEEKGIPIKPEMVIINEEDLFEFRINCTSAQIF